jgi:DNA-3-methyladenine glycosylase II
MTFAAQHIKAARHHLQRTDPTMRLIIKRVGPFTARLKRDRFGTLVQSIVSQQISGMAARSILSRLEALVGPQTIRPDVLRALDSNTLRSIGLSRQKVTYILDLAEKVDSSSVDLDRLSRLEDEEIIEELTRIKGIGRWTAQMFLMFSLGRLDVLPTADLGLQNAIKKNYKTRGELSSAKIERLARPWRPYATIACWYLWQSLSSD